MISGELVVAEFYTAYGRDLALGLRRAVQGIKASRLAALDTS